MIFLTTCPKAWIAQLRLPTHLTTLSILTKRRWVQYTGLMVGYDNIIGDAWPVPWISMGSYLQWILCWSSNIILHIFKSVFLDRGLWATQTERWSDLITNETKRLALAMQVWCQTKFLLWNCCALLSAGIFPTKISGVCCDFHGLVKRVGKHTMMHHLNLWWTRARTGIWKDSDTVTHFAVSLNLSPSFQKHTHYADAITPSCTH